MYDPWVLYPAHLPGRTCWCSAGSARASRRLVKTYIYRQAVFGRQAWVLDSRASTGRWRGRSACSRSPSRRAARCGSIRSARGAAARDQLSLLRSVAAGGAAPRAEPGGGRRAAGGAGDRRRGIGRRRADAADGRRRAAPSPRGDGRRASRRPSREDFAEANRAVGAGPAAPLRGRPARHVRRADQRGPRPRRAAGRARPERRARLRRAGDPDDLRRRLAAGDPAGAKARRRAGGRARARS